MKKVIASMLAVAGFAVAANAQDSTQLRYEVSLDGITWGPSVNANPGQTVEVRARVIYSGSTSVGGLAQAIFSPVFNSWQGAGFTGNGPAGDNVVVQTQGAITDTIGPFGGTRTTPMGSVSDSPGQYGRITPFASAANSSTSYYRGFVGTGSNAGLMRVAAANITNWFGAGATSGSNTINNVSGRGGINAGQLAGSLRNATDPAFNPSLDVVVFKMAVTLSSATSLRTMNVSTPDNGIGRQLVGGLPAGYDVTWYLDASTTSVNRVPTVTVQGANINVVPTPASLALLGLGGLAIARRRR